MAAVAPPPAAAAEPAPPTTAATNGTTNGGTPGEPYSWDLIPADQLRALYDSRKRVLTLYAKGTILVMGTHGKEFRRKPFLPGPAFELGAWYPHWRLPATENYTYSQNFRMTLPPSVKFIPIHVLNGWKAVPVLYLLSATEEEKSDPFSVSALTDALPATALLPSGIEEKSTPASLEDHLQIAIVDVPFEVSAPTEGSTWIHFDRSLLDLETAYSTKGNITWVFVPKHVGGTEIIIDHFNPWGVSTRTIIYVTIVGDDHPVKTQ